MSNLCDLHIVRDCPLCKPKVIAPPISAAPLAASGVSLAPAPQEASAAEPFQNQKAISMMEAAKKYSQSVEDLAVITNRINDLELELDAAKKHYHEFLAAQNAANAEMRALLDSLAATTESKADNVRAVLLPYMPPLPTLLHASGDLDA